MGGWCILYARLTQNNSYTQLHSSALKFRSCPSTLAQWQWLSVLSCVCASAHTHTHTHTLMYAGRWRMGHYIDEVVHVSRRLAVSLTLLHLLTPHPPTSPSLPSSRLPCSDSHVPLFNLSAVCHLPNPCTDQPASVEENLYTSLTVQVFLQEAKTEIKYIFSTTFSDHLWIW